MKKILFVLIGLLFAVPAVAATLPAGYTELQYIESTGTQYIDTGVVAKNNILTNCKFNFISSGSDAEVLFGISAGTGSRYWFGEQNGISFIGFNDAASGPTNIGTSVHTVSLKAVENLENALFIDGTRTNSFDNLTNQSDKSIYLFALRSGNAPVYVSSARVYSCSITKNNTLVRNFVPAKNASGVIGMYDTVSGQFFTNQGTGEFVAGPEAPIRIATTAYNTARFSPVVTELNTTIATIRSVVTNTINQTKAIADLQATKQTRPDETCPAGKKCLLVEDDAGQPHWYEIIESASRLPAGYTELEYIESTGTQEIDTGVLPSAVDDIYVRFKNTTTDAGYLIGAAGGNQYNYVGIHQAFSGYGENWGGSSQYTGFSIPADTSNIHVIKVDLTSAPKFYLDSALKATQGTYATITSTYTLRVNANVYGDTKRCSARYYDVKLSKNGSLVRDFVPAKNSSGVVGMYDTVSGQFFTNAGSGTFVAGPEI